MKRIEHRWTTGLRTAIALYAILVAGCAERRATPPEAALSRAAPAARAQIQCRDRNPLHNAYFGELHVHTAASMDAYAFDVRATPDDAYRFARGEALDLVGSRRVKLERPLDFAAVTDHASYTGEWSLCTRPDSPVFASRRCRTYRGEVPPAEGVGVIYARLSGLIPDAVSTAARSAELCGEDFERCRAEMQSVWEANQASTERNNQPCRFTAFHGYEYTATPELTKVHHNVVFRNHIVPPRPVAWVDEPSAWGLWEKLATQCLDAGTGCDVLTIPHNSNLSSGRLFDLDYTHLPRAAQIARARLRARLEPLVEIMQTKGDSECRNGLWKVMGGPDEQCDFEKLRPLEPAPEDCRDGTGSGGLIQQGCVSRLNFVRYALTLGLAEADRIGVNPYKLGITAGTDAHNGNPGDVEEASFDGYAGANDASALARLRSVNEVSPAARQNPGGLIGVWAPENTRDALFDAMQRRETFGTSGPRIQPRLFGGWSLPAELCEDVDWLRRGYAEGVAMGSDLRPRPEGARAPRFIVSALRDPGADGLATNNLQRIQIIKGWPGADGELHQAVFEVAGGATQGDAADPRSCTPASAGHAALCAVWTDPDFDPSQRAVYYARVLETPSCRWSRRQCNALPESQQPPVCRNGAVPDLIQERAWTSPIWYAPDPRTPRHSSAQL